jgi:5'-methylthioadenosine phosphorylase
MTAVPEFKLAREAEMAYCQVCLVTDYDCWHPDHDQVTVELVMQNLKANSETAQRCVVEVIKRLAANKFVSPAHDALKFAILTPKDRTPTTLIRLLLSFRSLKRRVSGAEQISLRKAALDSMRC